ncbi:hypothetical protein [Photorhabdus antumapuensis]|uniref:hypothetical protein n=1 Tax=Photorhabdus antumapuensis TaxID=2862867 RepID=UPI001CED6364|nr:hypothetical protein [Photorhabdus antumapuensis]MCA6219967.1 hypothetical protein [Photorhabdus antumapuensis]
MYHNEHQIMKAVYDHFYGQINDNGVIPIDLRVPSLIGTVQDHTRKVFVAKKFDCENLQISHLATEEVSRYDIYENNFLYNIIDNGKPDQSVEPVLIEDIFAGCKARTAKLRTSVSMPVLTK